MTEKNLADMGPEERSELLANYSDAAGEVAHRLHVLAALSDADRKAGKIEELKRMVELADGRGIPMNWRGVAVNRIEELEADHD